MTNFQITHNVLVLFPQPRYLKNNDDTEFSHELISTIKNNEILNSNSDNARVKNLLDTLHKNIL